MSRTVLVMAFLLILLGLSFMPSVFATGMSIPQFIFQKTWGGPSYEQGSAVATDSSGNIYVAGATSSTSKGSSDLDVLLLKFDSLGKLLLSKVWGGTGTDEATAIAIDPSGPYIYVAGWTSNSFAGTGGNADALLLKLDRNLNLLLATTWGGSSDDYANGVAVNTTSGDIYVTGTTTSYTTTPGGFTSGPSDVFLLKFHADLSLAWARTWGTYGYDIGNSVAVGQPNHLINNGKGEIFITGSSQQAGYQPYLLYLIFDDQGNVLQNSMWTAKPGTGDNEGFGISVAPGTLSPVITGFTNGTGAGGYDAVLLVPGVDALAWGASGNELGYSVTWALNASSSLQFVGYLAGSSTSYGSGGLDALLLKFTFSNTGLKVLSDLGWGGTGDDVAYGVAMGPATPGYASKNAIVTGYVSEAAPYIMNNIGGISTTLSAGMIVFNGNVGSPPYQPVLISASTTSISGSTNYAGGHDVFLYEFGTAQAKVPIPSYSLFLVALTTVGLNKILRYRRRG